MRKLIVTTFLGIGIAALLPAGCIPGVGASNAPAPTTATQVAAHV